ncbi:MAG: transporter associated domain-containing protein, partial [Candidatus Nanopelagicales bacterium]|nr:transporter associated domain-containing protein [Candidatus Nanopelagicales bacterium]
DGLMNVDDFADECGIELPEGPYETIAGFVIASLGHLPEIDDTVTAAGHAFTVTELDGRRIARISVLPVVVDDPVLEADASLPQ